jgi:hypothetical protein
MDRSACVEGGHGHLYDTFLSGHRNGNRRHALPKGSNVAVFGNIYHSGRSDVVSRATGQISISAVSAAARYKQLHAFVQSGQLKNAGGYLKAGPASGSARVVVSGLPWGEPGQ